MNEKLKDRDVLLVREKDSSELHAAGTGKDGKVKTAKLNDGENPDFLKINKRGNILENFFENFMRQVKNPTRFEFFRVPAEKFNEIVQKLQEAFKNPDKPENKQLLDLHRIDPEDFLKKQAQEKSQSQPQQQAQAPEKSHAIDPGLVKWDKLEKFGLTRETLEKTGISKDGANNLDHLLDYRKTNLVTVTLKVDNETTVRTDARLSLRRQEDGSFVPAIHPIRHKPDLDSSYFGIKFTEEDRQNLLKTGNLGRIAEAEFKPGEKTPVLLSIDRQTNELVAFRKEWLKVPDAYKGVTLNEEQKRLLGEGKAIKLENMTTNDGSKQFSANVQFNTDKRYFELVFDNDRKQAQNVKQGSENGDAPKTFRKKELTEDQRSSLREGKTVHTGELTDSKGKKYSGYITVNKESGKLDFMFPKDYRDALSAGKVVPDDRHKTQVAKNNEGKTTEATKNVKEPLNSGQTQPTEKQAARQEEKKEVKKSKGMKM